MIAVPPLARARNGGISIAENRKILDWMAAGGVSTFLYGGNANFYNLGLLEYPLTLEVLAGIAPGRRLDRFPSIGPDFGKALDQVTMLKSFDFPTAMALPMTSATKTGGVATGSAASPTPTGGRSSPMSAARATSRRRTSPR